MRLPQVFDKNEISGRSDFVIRPIEFCNETFHVTSSTFGQLINTGFPLKLILIGHHRDLEISE
jgi:hypothetical protein